MRTRGARPPKTVDLRPLLGTWVNYDAGTPGIARIEVEDRSGRPVVRVVQAGPLWPEPGETVGAAFSAGAALHEAIAFAARFEVDGAHVLLAAYLNKRLLVVDSYTAGADADHFHRDHFYLP
jgi:hypothetical protein